MEENKRLKSYIGKGIKQLLKERLEWPREKGTRRALPCSWVGRGGMGQLADVKNLGNWLSTKKWHGFPLLRDMIPQSQMTLSESIYCKFSCSDCSVPVECAILLK